MCRIIADIYNEFAKYLFAFGSYIVDESGANNKHVSGFFVPWNIV